MAANFVLIHLFAVSIVVLDLVISILLVERDDLGLRADWLAVDGVGVVRHGWSWELAQRVPLKIRSKKYR